MSRSGANGARVRPQSVAGPGSHRVEAWCAIASSPPPPSRPGAGARPCRRSPLCSVHLASTMIRRTTESALFDSSPKGCSDGSSAHVPGSRACSWSGRLRCDRHPDGADPWLTDGGTVAQYRPCHPDASPGPDARSQPGINIRGCVDRSGGRDLRGHDRDRSGAPKAGLRTGRAHRQGRDGGLLPRECPGALGRARPRLLDRAVHRQGARRLAERRPQPGPDSSPSQVDTGSDATRSARHRPNRST